MFSRPVEKEAARFCRFSEGSGYFHRQTTTQGNRINKWILIHIFTCDIVLIKDNSGVRAIGNSIGSIGISYPRLNLM